MTTLPEHLKKKRDEFIDLQIQAFFKTVKRLGLEVDEEGSTLIIEDTSIAAFNAAYEEMKKDINLLLYYFEGYVESMSCVGYPDEEMEEDCDELKQKYKVKDEA